MDRRFDGRWTHEEMVPGDTSLLTRAEACHWNWSNDVEVTHVYLTHDLLAKVSAEVFDKDVDDVRLLDVLRARDPVLHHGAMEIAREAASGGTLGGSLYVDAVSRQMSVHILRRYATITFRESVAGGGLSPQRAKQVVDYVDAHLGEAISLDDLATVAGQSAWHFLRQFKGCFGVAPHAWVLGRRIDRARELLAKTDLPIKDVAARVGFYDQAHLTRVFGRFVGTTPRVFRDSVV